MHGGNSPRINSRPNRPQFHHKFRVATMPETPEGNESKLDSIASGSDRELKE